MAKTIFALIDCNNFYCSCERVFRPALAHRPIIVLSNNDGCAVARSNEVKALGIKMGEPEFKIRDLIRRHHIQVFSSNYTLYGDMSRRVQEVVSKFTPSFEVYSIDEMFMNLSGFERQGLSRHARLVRDAVRQWVGIPTCVGIAPTKTLAKIANHLAKKGPTFDGVCNLMDEGERHQALRHFPVEDVWGIGYRTVPKLHAMGIRFAGQLRDMNIKQARRYGGVVAERLVLELQGISCLPLEEVPAAKKGTAVTRSFGAPVFQLDELMEAISFYCSRGGEKLRRDGLVAGQLTVFMHTNRFKTVPQYYGTRSAKLLPITNDSRIIIKTAHSVAKAIYRQGFEYNKAGIFLDDLRRESDKPQTFFCDEEAGASALMTALDSVNAKYGQSTLRFAAQGSNPRWWIKAGNRSPAYTTRLSDVPVVKAR